MSAPILIIEGSEFDSFNFLFILFVGHLRFIEGVFTIEQHVHNDGA